MAFCSANENWAGYDASYQYNNNAYFTYAQAHFNLPDVHFNGPNGYDNIVVAWVGLGPYIPPTDAHGIWQAGVLAIDDPSYSVFFEDLGCTGPSVSGCPKPAGGSAGDPLFIKNLYVAPGDDVEVGVGASAGQGTYFVQDTTQGYYTGVVTFNPLEVKSDSTRNTPLTADAADFIVEKTAKCDTQCDVQSMSQVHFYDALAQLSSGERRWLEQWKVTRYDLCTAYQSDYGHGNIPPPTHRIGLPSALIVDHGYYVAFDGTTGNTDCIQEGVRPSAALSWAIGEDG